MIADAPEGLLAALDRPVREHRAALEGFTFDEPYNVAWAQLKVEQAIARGDLPIVGNRDAHATSWAIYLTRLGCGAQVARELYEAFFEHGGARPTSPGDIDEKFERAAAGLIGDSEPGGEAPVQPSVVFADAVKQHVPEPEFRLLGHNLITRKALAYWDEDHNLPRASNGFVGLQLGSHDAFKTVLNLSLYADAKDKPRVLYCIGEGEDTMGALILAQCQARGITEDQFLDQIEFADIPLVDIPGLPHNAGIDGSMKRFVDWLRSITDEFRPDIIHLDTFASMIAGRIGEMDDRAGAIFTRHGCLRGLARDRKALVMTTHHINREDAKQNDPAKIHSRGHSAPESNGDLILKQVREGEAIHLFRSRCRGGRGKAHFYYGIDRIGDKPDPLDNPPVAQKISEAQFHMLTGTADSLSRDKIHSHLMVMGVGRDWSTLELVMHMFPKEKQDHHDWQVGLNRMAGMLERAKEKLPGLWSQGVEGTRWSAS